MKVSSYNSPAEEAVSKFEASSSLCLPEAYKSFLKSSIELPIDLKPVPVTDPVPKQMEYFVDDGHVSVGHFLGTRIKDGEYVLDAVYLAREWEIPDKMVLIAGDGHTWFALDYSAKRADPPVVFLAGYEWLSVRVANHFEEFLSMCEAGAPNQ